MVQFVTSVLNPMEDPMGAPRRQTHIHTHTQTHTSTHTTTPLPRRCGCHRRQRPRRGTAAPGSCSPRRRRAHGGGEAGGPPPGASLINVPGPNDLACYPRGPLPPMESQARGVCKRGIPPMGAPPQAFIGEDGHGLPLLPGLRATFGLGAPAHLVKAAAKRKELGGRRTAATRRWPSRPYNPSPTHTWVPLAPP